MALLWRHLLFPLFIFLSTCCLCITGVGSVPKQLMNTLMTVASAKGILPDIVSVLDSAASVDVNISVPQLLNLIQLAQNQISACGLPTVQQASSSCLNTNYKPNYAATLQEITPCEASALPNTIYSSQNDLQSLVKNQLTQLNSLAPQIPASTQYNDQVCQNTPQTSISLPIIPALLQDANLYSPNLQLNEATTLPSVDLVALTPTNFKTVSVSQCDKPLGVEVSISPLTVEVPVPVSSSTCEAPQSHSVPPIIVVPVPVRPPRSSGNALLPLLLLSLLDNNNGNGNCGGGGRGYCNYGYGNNCGCSCGCNSYCSGNTCGCSGYDSPCSEILYDDPSCTEPMYPVYVPEDNLDPFADGPLYNEDRCYYYYRCK